PRPLVRFRRVAVAAPGYIRQHGMPRDPIALASHDCLVQLGAAGAIQEWQFTREGEATAVRVRGALRVTGPVALLDSCVAGMGIALLRWWLLGRTLAEGKLKRLLADWTPPPTIVGALYPSEPRPAALTPPFVNARADPASLGAAEPR